MQKPVRQGEGSGRLMALPVVTGASIACTMGMAPGTLIVTSQAMILMGGVPAATIQDAAPFTNITPCGLCNSMANPVVAAATAANLGVFTPAACIPTPAGIWLGAVLPLISGVPGLNTDCKLLCSYGGSISIVSPGQGAVIY